MIGDAQKRRLQLWFAAIAATTLLVLVVGGVTRLTHSGLSIVEWRPVVGIVPPLSEAEWLESFDCYQQFPEYRQVRSNMTLGEYKDIYFWEYLHRLLARAIGLVFLVPFAFFYFSGALTPTLLRRSIALFALGGLQGVVGWLMVQSGLIDRPSVSHYRLAIHLSLALAIFGMCVWLIRDLAVTGARTALAAPARVRMRRALITLGCLLALQIVWGAFVAGLKAGLGFNTFPLMDGSLLPYWTTGVLDFVQQPAAVQWTHRFLGTVVLATAIAVDLRARRLRLDRTSIRFSDALLAAVAAQYTLGVLTLLYIVPISLAVAHQATAMAIVGVWVAAFHHVQHLEGM